MVYDHSLQQLTVPTVLERERCMGFIDHATASPWLSSSRRSSLLGNSFDIHTLTWLLKLSISYHCLALAPSFVACSVPTLQHATGGTEEQAKHSDLEKKEKFDRTSDIRSMLKFGKELAPEWKQRFAEQAQNHRRAFAYDLREIG